MLLLLFRHGPAQDQAPDGGDDLRALTAKGIKRTRACARGLRRLIDPPDVLFTSPKLRAAQTADLLAEVLDIKPTAMPELAQGSPHKLLRKLARLNKSEVMLVGHEPMLSQIIALICAGDAHAQFAPMKKSSCACLRWDEPSSEHISPGRLLWLAPPSLLRRLAR